MSAMTTCAAGYKYPARASGRVTVTMPPALLLLAPALAVVAAAKPSSCPADKVRLEQFHPWTQVTRRPGGKVEPRADAPCWFDLTRWVNSVNKSRYRVSTKYLDRFINSLGINTNTKRDHQEGLWPLQERRQAVRGAHGEVVPGPRQGQAGGQ